MLRAKPRVLAIDDTPANLLTLGAVLKNDYDLQIATSGLMGLDLAIKAPPDLILLDIMMPGIDGFETCRRIKAEPTLKDIPVIFITALNAIESEIQGLALGALDYINKPIQVETARQRIRNLLERESYRKELEIKSQLLEGKVTELQLAQDQLQLAANVFASAREGITITDMQGTIVDVNVAFTRITGYSREEVLGKNSRMLSSGLQKMVFYQEMWQQLTSKGHWYGELWNRRKNGQLFAEMLNISTVFDAEGKPQHYVGLFSDITAIKEHEKELYHIAHYDILTGLPNRVLLADRLRQGMVQATRRSQQLAVVFLDLDGFKVINDNHGHEVGDQLLMTIAKRMKQTLRDGDTLARLGGDEFVAVLVDIEETGASEPMLQRLLEAAAQPLVRGGVSLQVSASVGVTFYPQSQDIDAEQLMRQADQSMYQSKLAGKNRFHIFDAVRDCSLRTHHESLERIRHALHAGEFVLHYQPKVNLRSGEVIGAEALIRWQHPEKGLLLPGLFLPVIEDHQLAVEVGEWVIQTALSQMTHWQTLGLTVPVSVNVGARQLQQVNFVERLRQILALQPNTRPGMLEIEVLETSALENVSGVSQVIEQCRLMGVSFALDDFGTGYSSLTYLKRLPVAVLKIDQSFVRDMLVDSDDMAILQGVISLARAFSRQVIAEGVETSEHSASLLKLGCELAQGFGIARPMPAQQMPEWILSWEKGAV
jgi:diguanylate cyclase (GGDEF)-like protein/PAS domain S-box-containing protein